MKQVVCLLKILLDQIARHIGRAQRSLAIRIAQGRTLLHPIECELGVFGAAFARAVRSGQFVHRWFVPSLCCGFCPSKTFGLQFRRVAEVQQLVAEQGLAKYFFKYRGTFEVADALLFAARLIKQHAAIGGTPNRTSHANSFFNPVGGLFFVYGANRRAIHVLVIHKGAC